MIEHPLRNRTRLLKPSLNIAQDASDSLSQAEITAGSFQPQNKTSAGSVGPFRSLGNHTNIVTPFDLEFERICYIISLSSFRLAPETLFTTLRCQTAQTHCSLRYDVLIRHKYKP